MYKLFFYIFYVKKYENMKININSILSFKEFLLKVQFLFSNLKNFIK